MGVFIFLPSPIFPFLNQLLLDLMAFREQALRLILDLSSTVITLLVSQRPSPVESIYLLLVGNFEFSFKLILLVEYEKLRHVKFVFLLVEVLSMGMRI